MDRLIKLKLAHAQLHLEILLNIDSQPELIPHDINSKTIW